MIHARFSKRLDRFALEVEFEAKPGVTVLYGASGAGKTLTLDCLAGFVKPDSGRILLDDTILFDSGAQVNLTPQNRNCGYVFQDHALFPHMTVRSNLLFAAQRHARLERYRRVEEAMERFRISEFAPRLPHELSGGQKQRCSVARALIAEPRMLLLDEPARGLDSALRDELYELIGLVRSEFRIPILLVTHDWKECFALGDGVLILQGGKLLQTGKPREIYDRPATAEIARLLGIVNVFDAEILALDPGRNTSCLRMLGREFRASYFPGRLLGDRVKVCVAPANLRVQNSAGKNCVPAKLVRVTELPDSVKLRFDPEITVELSCEQYAAHPISSGWFIQFPSESLRATD